MFTILDVGDPITTVSSGAPFIIGIIVVLLAVIFGVCKIVSTVKRNKAEGDEVDLDKLALAATPEDSDEE